VKCPHCGLLNPPSAQRCDCGYDFVSRQIQRSYLKQAEPPDRIEIWEIPKLAKGQSLDLPAIRVPYERFYLFFVALPTPLSVAILVFLAVENIEVFFIVVGVILFFALLTWIGWKLTFAFLLGHSIKVGPTQYPQIHYLVTDASEILGVDPPTVLITQGHGLFEALIAKRFSRRSLLILTSNLLDDLTEHGSSRELMFFVGRQLGLMANGYFRLWPLKHILGQFSLFFYWAWQRRSHMTADRLGLLVAGDLYAAEQALVIITAGSGISQNINLEALKEQRTELFDSFWSWIQLGVSAYPYIVDRIVRLRQFAYEAARRGIQANTPVAVGALPIVHRPIRAVPLMIVHGHDLGARLELENFLLRRFPHVKPMVMVHETDAAMTLPEKFERIASEVKGALALLTPDDLVTTLKTDTEQLRARQNVIVEISWFWGHLGRGKCLLLMRGDLEIPSDLSGVEVHRFSTSPTECSEALRDFISKLEVP
jgi:Predicted nucleotide-binding protein containing TIR-like domain